MKKRGWKNYLGNKDYAHWSQKLGTFANCCLKTTEQCLLNFGTTDFTNFVFIEEWRLLKAFPNKKKISICVGKGFPYRTVDATRRCPLTCGAKTRTKQASLIQFGIPRLFNKFLDIIVVIGWNKMWATKCEPQTWILYAMFGDDPPIL